VVKISNNRFLLFYLVLCSYLWFTFHAPLHLNEQLLEVHSHSLFSKWFSESGKLVAKLFAHIQELLEDPNTLVCVLIDEVESLAAARSTSIGNGEPSDAIRTVNAMLTAIDRLRKFPNVLIFTTTNMSSASVLDLAFIDRADVKQYIGLPPLEARYEILRSCILELMRCGIVVPPSDLRADAGQSILLSYKELSRKGYNGVSSSRSAAASDGMEMSDDIQGKSLVLNTYVPPSLDPGDKGETSESLKLMHCAQHAETLSGRSLRKLPFQSHAQFLRSTTASLSKFLDALSQGIAKERVSRSQLEQK